MTMTLYKILSDPNALNPYYFDDEGYTDSPITINSVVPYEALDDLSGFVILDYNSAYEGYNGAFLSETGKFYTITSKELLTGQRIRLNLRVDVMKTYQSEITNCTGILLRSSNTSIGNSYINDGKRDFEAGKTTSNIELGRISYSGNIVLCAIGCNAQDPNDLNFAKQKLLEIFT